MKEYILDFEIFEKPVFTNHMYRAVKSKANGWAVLGKTNDLIKYQRRMRKEILPEVLPDDKIKEFISEFSKNLYDIEVETVYEVPQNSMYEFDASNLIKAYEDCIARHLGIDDCYTTKYTIEKRPSENNQWYAHTIMKLVPRRQKE